MHAGICEACGSFSACFWECLYVLGGGRNIALCLTRALATTASRYWPAAYTTRLPTLFAPTSLHWSRSYDILVGPRVGFEPYNIVFDPNILTIATGERGRSIV